MYILDKLSKTAHPLDSDLILRQGDCDNLPADDGWD